MDSMAIVDAKMRATPTIATNAIMKITPTTVITPTMIAEAPKPTDNMAIVDAKMRATPTIATTAVMKITPTTVITPTTTAANPKATMAAKGWTEITPENAETAPQARITTATLVATGIITSTMAQDTTQDMTTSTPTIMEEPASEANPRPSKENTTPPNVGRIWTGMSGDPTHPRAAARRDSYERERRGKYRPEKENALFWLLHRWWADDLYSDRSDLRLLGEG
jgi:hypothetical protein